MVVCCLLVGADAHAQSTRCVVGDLALPAPGIWTTKADGVWSTVAMDDLPKGLTGCTAMRVTAPDTVSGVAVVRATPRSALAGMRVPHERLLRDVIDRLTTMNVRITEPKWRKMDVPFSGLQGFGNGTMFGFDGAAIDGGERSDVIVLVFDGPAHHYDLTLVGASEAVDEADWRQTVAGFRALVSGFNKVKR